MKIAVNFVDAFTFHSSFLMLAPQTWVLNLRSLLLNTVAQKALQKKKKYIERVSLLGLCDKCIWADSY